MKVQHHLRELVAEEVRALLARRRLNGAKLATAIGKSEMYVSRRLRGETAFDLDDLEKIADVLGVPVGQLLPQSVQEGTITRYSSLAERMTPPVTSARPSPTRPAGRPDSVSAGRTAKVATRPVGHSGTSPRRVTRLAA